MAESRHSRHRRYAAPVYQDHRHDCEFKVQVCTLSGQEDLSREDGSRAATSRDLTVTVWQCICQW
jgi:hypothetical protein